MQELKENGFYDPSSGDRWECAMKINNIIACSHLFSICSQILVFVIHSLLQRELTEFMQYWNSHTIRTNTSTECPAGIPDDLYRIPEEFCVFIYT